MALPRPVVFFEITIPFHAEISWELQNDTCNSRNGSELNTSEYMCSQAMRQARVQ